MKRYTIIVAGGSGQRMGKDIPKQFIELCGKPILMHTIQQFHEYNACMKLIVVLPEEQMVTWMELCKKHHFCIKHDLIEGGKERFHSVKNGLAAIDEEGIVAIHDGVRPLVSLDTLKRCFETALDKGNAIPVIDVFESIRQFNNEGNRAVNRAEFKLVQTPQVFRTDAILEAYNSEFSTQFTDDASVVESIGKTINLVEGNRENIKVTTPYDLIIGEALLKLKANSSSFLTT